MESDLVATASLGGAEISAHLSPWALFIQADFIVKAVMIILVLGHHFRQVGPAS